MTSPLRFIQRLIAASFLLLTGVASAQPASGPNKLQLASGEVEVPATFGKVPVEHLRPAPGEAVAGRYYRVVQFEELPTDAERAALAGRGAELLDYLPQLAYFAAFDVAVDPSAALRGLAVRAVLPVEPFWKLSRGLAAYEYPPHALRPDHRLALIVQPFAPVPLSEAIARLRALGGEVGDEMTNGGLEVIVPVGQERRVAAEPWVQYVEAAPPPPSLEADRDVANHRSNVLNSNLPTGRHYDGTGVTVSEGDDGQVGPHIDFQGRLTNVLTTNGGDHGDHVAGIIGGAGNLNPVVRGQAPGVTLRLYSGHNDIGQAATIYATNGVRITSHSLGQTCNGGYTADARTADQQIRLNTALMHVFSSGNSGTSACGYGTVTGWGNITGGYKMGKNVLAVGNLSHLDVLSSSSSVGPASDGRIKPDICAVGSSVLSTGENNTYYTASGTSMACPAVSGVLAQLYQAYRSLNAGADPNSALIKAAVLNTAEDLGNAGPDYRHGFGRINALRAVEVLENNRFATNTLTTSQSRTHAIVVPAGAQQLRVMVYWNDYEAASNAATALVNDIDMTLTTPGGTIYQPWVLNPAANATTLNAPATRGADHLNNVEQVTLDAPAAGTYTVSVRGHAVPQGPQRYYVVYTWIQDGVTITHPIGGEAFVPGESQVLRWDAGAGTTGFTLSYSTDGGVNWASIGTAAAGARAYTWTVPGVASGQVQVRVVRGAQTSQSANFTIVGVPQNLAVQWVCATQTRLTWSAVTGATSYELFYLGGQKMEPMGTVTGTASVVNNVPATNTYWFSVRALGPNGLVGRRANALFRGAGEVNCPVPFNAAVTAVSSPAAGRTSCQPGSTSVPVTVTVANQGTSSISNVPMRYRVNNGVTQTGTTSGSLAPGASMSFTFPTGANLSAGGTYAFKVWAALATDGNRTNDTLQFSVTVIGGTTATLPVTQSFDALTNCATTTNCGTTVCGLGGGWQNAANGTVDNIDWRVLSGPTATTSTGPDVDHTLGTAAGRYVYLEASSCFGQTAHLLSPCVNLAGASSPNLTFWYHLYGANMGELHLDVLHNGGWTLDVIPVLSGNQGNQWLQASLSLSPWIGQTIVLRWRGVTGANIASDMALDDIRIQEQALAPAAAFTPTPASPCRGATVVMGESSANGPTNWSWSFTPGPVVYVDGTSSTSRTPHVQFGATGPQTATLIATNAVGSGTTTRSLTVTDGTTLPFSQPTFAGAWPPAGWRVKSAGGTHTWQQSGSITGPTGSQGQFAALNNYSYNNRGAEDALVLPRLDLRGFLAPQLRFYVAYAPYSAANSDGLRVDLSNNCGESYAPSAFYKEGLVLGTTGGYSTSSTWAPASAGQWRQEVVDLGALMVEAGEGSEVQLVNVNGFGNWIYLAGVTVEGQAPLPVTLLGLQAERQGAGVALSWQTAQEANTSRFEVERSGDGIRWRRLTDVAAAGYSSEKRTYGWTDREAPAGLTYYRLRMVDHDEAFRYSSLVSVRASGRQPELTAYPVPFADELRVQAGEAVREISLLDALGRVVLRVVPEREASEVVLDTHLLPAGSYVVRATTAAGERRVVVVR